MRAALILTLLLASPAYAEELPCLPHSEMVAHLAEAYGERQVSIGVTAQGPLVEMFVSQSGTWTMIVTSTNQDACAAASGDGFMMIADGEVG